MSNGSNLNIISSPAEGSNEPVTSRTPSAIGSGNNTGGGGLSPEHLRQIMKHGKEIARLSSTIEFIKK